MKRDRDILKRITSFNWAPILYVIIFVSFFSGAIIASLQGNWDSVALAVISMALFASPFLLRKQTKIYIPTLFSLFISLFLYATLILGQLEQYYQKFWWWDSMLHAGSGIAFGLTGLMVILIFFRLGKIAAPRGILCLFAFCFALSIGLLWEVFEFIGDQLLHTNMQQLQTGVVDTMKDLIMDTIGAFIGSVIGYFYLGSKVGTPLDAVISKTVRKNRKSKKS